MGTAAYLNVLGSMMMCMDSHMCFKHCALQGNVGTAAYLNVFGSIFRVLKELKAKVCLFAIRWQRLQRFWVAKKERVKYLCLSILCVCVVISRVSEAKQKFSQCFI